MPLGDPQIDPQLGPWIAPDHWFLPEAPPEAVATPAPVDSSLAGVPSDAGPLVGNGPYPMALSPSDVVVADQSPQGIPLAPVHPADIAAADIHVGPPAPLHLPYGLDVPVMPPDPASASAAPPSVAELPGIAISQEGSPGGAGLPGVPAVLPSEIPVPAPPFGPQLAPAEQHYRETVRQYASDLDQIPDPIERQRALNDLYTNHQVDAAELEARRAMERDAYIARRKREIIEADRDAAQQAYDDLKAAHAATDAKMAQVSVDIDRISKMPVTDGLSQAQKIGGVLMGLVGGLYQAKTGGANIGLDALNTAINRNIAEQRASLELQMRGAEGKRSLLAQEYARHGDLYRAEETLRLSMLRSADEQLAIEQQNYAPEGTTGRKIAAIRAATQSAITQRALDMSTKFKKEALEEREQTRKEAETVATIVEKKASAAKSYAEIDKLRDELRDKITPDQMRAENPNLPTAAIPTTAMSRKDWLQHLTAYKTGQEISNQSPENLRGIPGVTVTDKDGKKVPFLAQGRPEFVEAAKKKKAAVSKIVALMDDALRTRTGWSSDVGNSDERQQLDTIWNTAQLEVKEAYSLGAISETDAKYMNGVLGASDPSKIRDPIAGMRKARQIFENNLNVDLHAVGLPDDQRFEIPDMSRPAAPKESAEDKQLKMVLDDPVKVGRASWFVPEGAPRPVEEHRSGLPMTPTDEHDAALRQGIDEATHRQRGVDVQKQQINSWARIASDSSNPGHDEAWRAITDTAGTERSTGAATAEVRDYAQAVVRMLTDEGIGRTPSVIPEGR